MDSDFIYFLLELFLGLIGIWVGIYLYLREQTKKQEQQYNFIIRQIAKPVVESFP